jgi:hypothetical protein
MSLTTSRAMGASQIPTHLISQHTHEVSTIVPLINGEKTHREVIDLPKVTQLMALASWLQALPLVPNTWHMIRT